MGGVSGRLCINSCSIRFFTFNRSFIPLLLVTAAERIYASSASDKAHLSLLSPGSCFLHQNRHLSQSLAANMPPKTSNAKKIRQGYHDNLLNLQSKVHDAVIISEEVKGEGWINGFSFQYPLSEGVWRKLKVLEEKDVSGTMEGTSLHEESDDDLRWNSFLMELFLERICESGTLGVVGEKCRSCESRWNILRHGTREELKMGKRWVGKLR